MLRRPGRPLTQSHVQLSLQIRNGIVAKGFERDEKPPRLENPIDLFQCPVKVEARKTSEIGDDIEASIPERELVGVHLEKLGTVSREQPVGRHLPDLERFPTDID